MGSREDRKRRKKDSHRRKSSRHYDLEKRSQISSYSTERGDVRRESRYHNGRKYKKSRHTYSSSPSIDSRERSKHSKKRTRRRDKHKKRRRDYSSRDSSENEERIRKRDKEADIRKKQERRARIKALKFDDEYTDIINKNKQKTEVKKEEQKYDQEHIELADKLGFDPEELAKQIDRLDNINGKSDDDIKEEENKLEEIKDNNEFDNEAGFVLPEKPLKATKTEEIDPLEEFMNNLQTEKQIELNPEQNPPVITYEDIYNNDMQEEQIDEQEPENDEQFIEALKNAGKDDTNDNKQDDILLDQEIVLEQKEEDTQRDYFKTKDILEKKKQVNPLITNNSKIVDEIKKNLYVECPEIKALSEEEVEALKKQLGNIKIRGANPIKPIWSWYHCGLGNKTLDMLINTLGFTKPFPIQCQAIPILMSGRDCIGIAETGSGKTLAYLLPLIRHIKAQRPFKQADGPIGLIIVPIRELALQVYSTVSMIIKGTGLRAAVIYGGNSYNNQLSELKRGVEIVVCTPGRMIDAISLGKGSKTSLKRVTFVVIDEADRMFDMGYEPQLSTILENIRGTRQTALFSATFPKNVEILAKRVLKKPLEIVIGIRGQICRNVDQEILIIEEKQKLFKLLELLGIWLDRGSVLVFVDRKIVADELYTKLLAYKYKPLLLHGGQDQTDRENTLIEFKKQSKQVLIATSVLARGLDVDKIVLVLNYFCPTYKEDYIHRIG